MQGRENGINMTVFAAPDSPIGPDTPPCGIYSVAFIRPTENEYAVSRFGADPKALDKNDKM